MLGNKKPKGDKPKGSKPPPMKRKDASTHGVEHMAEYEAAEITPESLKAAFRKLKSLDDYNNERIRLYKIGESVVLTGIACPKCGDELCESSPGWIHPSFPPKKAVICVKCGYKGTCIA